jgi:hypothetical protein
MSAFWRTTQSIQQADCDAQRWGGEDLPEHISVFEYSRRSGCTWTPDWCSRTTEWSRLDVHYDLVERENRRTLFVIPAFDRSRSSCATTTARTRTSGPRRPTRRSSPSASTRAAAVHSNTPTTERTGPRATASGWSCRSTKTWRSATCSSSAKAFVTRNKDRILIPSVHQGELHRYEKRRGLHCPLASPSPVCLSVYACVCLRLLLYSFQLTAWESSQDLCFRIYRSISIYIYVCVCVCVCVCVFVCVSALVAFLLPCFGSPFARYAAMIAWYRDRLAAVDRVDASGFAIGGCSFTSPCN